MNVGDLPVSWHVLFPCSLFHLKPGTSSYLLLHCPRDLESYQPNAKVVHLQLKTSQIKCNHCVCHSQI